MKRIVPCFALCALAMLPAYAQPSRFTGYVGGGFTEPSGSVGRRLDRGWNMSAGAGVNAASRLGVMVDFTFNDLGINQTALDRVGAPGGSTRIWAFTLNPVVRLAPAESPVDVYVTGGGGVYHRTVEFTQPAVATVTAFDPWFGVFYPADIVTNQVIGSYSVYKPGFNVGAGVSFRLGASNTKLFAEARYHRMFITNGIDTSFLPVTFGVRW